MTVATPEQIHAFWFGSLDANGLADTDHAKQWFVHSDAFDAQIRTQFSHSIDAAKDQQLQHWLTAPQSWLSFIILCDQFPRNLFRSSAAAFELDSVARDVARMGIEQGFARELGLHEQTFAYMPFMHSEELLDQYLSVGLFATLRDHAEQANRATAGTHLRHAQQHRDTIVRFGRFPYRNAALGRTSTAAELAYLEQTGS